MSNHPFLPQRSLFKAYDIRGDRALFTPNFLTCLSEAFAQHFLAHQARCLVIGFDARHASEDIARLMAQRISAHGIEVIWIGLVTTPMLAFWANEYQGHGIIATASHSEAHINGIKWLCAGESPSREDIQHLYSCLAAIADDPADIAFISANCATQQPVFQGVDDYPHDDYCKLPSAFTPAAAERRIQIMPAEQVAHGYFTKVAAAIKQIHHCASAAPTNATASNKTTSDKAVLNKTASSTAALPLKVVIDCLNGATGPFAQALFNQFTALCASVTCLNAEPDGDFPKGNPDPTEDGRLAELKAAVLAQQADIGLGFDGDGDRLMVVDNQGQVLAADHLLYLLAHIAIIERPMGAIATLGNLAGDQAPTVIFDVKCSHHLPSLIEQTGGRPQMGKTGSSIMRKALQNGSSHAIFAGELSGHFLFNDGYFVLHDDAMYAGLRLLNWLVKQPSTLAEIVSALPTMVNTADVYLPLTTATETCQQERSLLQRLSSLCQKLQNCCPSLCNQDPGNPAQAAPVSQSNSLGLPNNTRLTCIDGIRLDFSSGFGVIRPSNTSHSLTVRFAGNTLSDLRAVQQRFVDLCQFIDSDLASQIAKIGPSG